MTAKYTPGKWTAKDNVVYTDALGDPIAICECNVDLYWCPPVDGNTNAALIAAAPELLEALKHLINEVEFGIVSGPAKQNARAAIAKAEGGE